jgi:hypothetical protein
MESQQFDRIAQTLTETRTRRGALRLLAAAAFGAAIPVVASGDVDAKKRKKKGKKPGTVPAPAPSQPGGGSGGTGGGGGTQIPADMCPISRPAPNSPRCGGLPGEDCTCNLAVEGNNVCISFIETCSGWHPCNSTADCRETAGFHFVCQAAGSGSCGQVCLPTCDAQDPMVQSQSKRDRRGKNANAL